MIAEPRRAVDFGVAAILHFFMGLMRADGSISKKEVEKIRILIYKFDRGLPGEYERNAQKLDRIINDKDYDDWDKDRHLEQGLQYWESYFKSGEADESHLETILEIIEILSEIDEVANEEVDYIEAMKAEFTKRFNFQ